MPSFWRHGSWLDFGVGMPTFVVCVELVVISNHFPGCAPSRASDPPVRSLRRPAVGRGLISAISGSPFVAAA